MLRVARDATVTLPALRKLLCHSRHMRRPTLDQLPAAKLREMLAATERTVGMNSESAAIIRRALAAAEAREERRRKVAAHAK